MRRASSRRTLSAKFSALTLTILVVALAVFVPWSIQRQQEATEQGLVNEARTLNQQMAAAWQYVDTIQPIINYNDYGEFEFKHVYCATAAKAIAHTFTDMSDYTIRYVRENPRVSNDAPDSFELAAFEAFKNGSQEYSGIDRYGDESAFRYVAVLRVQANCLECHGNPAGERDITGFEKEGYELGEIAGAASIVIPLKNYEQSTLRNVLEDILFFACLTISLLLAINIAFRTLVTRPIQALEETTSHIAAGDWEEAEISLKAKASGEIASLQQSVLQMADLVKQAQESLENTVAQQTADLLEANEVLKLRHAQLDDAYQILQQTNDRLQMAISYKSDFLSAVSHEFKTPIASMLAGLELWKSASEDAPSRTSPERCLAQPSDAQVDADRALAENITANSRLLLSMVDNILDAAKMETQSLVPVPTNVDLIDVLGEEEALALPIAQHNGIAFDWSVEDDVPIIKSDPVILRRIIDNLVNNALKFTPALGAVAIRATLDSASDTVRIQISDTGVGISSADVDRIFERFTQADSSLSRSYGGTGLGLSVAEDMAKMLGGDIRVQSSPGQGSTFTVVLPLDCTWNPSKPE